MTISSNPGYLANRAFENYRNKGFLGDGVVTNSLSAEDQYWTTESCLSKLDQAESYVDSTPLSGNRGLELNLSQVNREAGNDWLNRESFQYGPDGSIANYSREHVQITPEQIQRLSCYTNANRLCITSTLVDRKHPEKSQEQSLEIQDWKLQK